MQKKPGTRPTRIEATHDKITTTALTLMLERGAQGLSISEICREANVARPTFYRHFPTMEAMLEAVFFKIRSVFDDGLKAAIERNPDPEQRLDVIAEYMGDHLLTGRTQQLYHSNQQFSVELMSRFFDSRVVLYENALAPFFDLADSVSGEKIDRREVSTMLNHYYVSMNLQAVFAPPQTPGRSLRKFIRALIHITVD